MHNSQIEELVNEELLWDPRTDDVNAPGGQALLPGDGRRATSPSWSPRMPATMPSPARLGRRLPRCRRRCLPIRKG
jgi:hypothetical protein